MDRRTGSDRRQALRGGRRKADKVSCPFCGHKRSSVAPMPGKSTPDGYYRTRVCDECELPFTTVEKVSHFGSHRNI